MLSPDNIISLVAIVYQPLEESPRINRLICCRIKLPRNNVCVLDTFLPLFFYFGKNLANLVRHKIRLFVIRYIVRLRFKICLHRLQPVVKRHPNISRRNLRQLQAIPAIFTKPSPKLQGFLAIVQNVKQDAFTEKLHFVFRAMGFVPSLIKIRKIIKHLNLCQIGISTHPSSSQARNDRIWHISTIMIKNLVCNIVTLNSRQH